VKLPGRMFALSAPGSDQRTFTARQYLDARAALLPHVSLHGHGDELRDAGAVRCYLYGEEVSGQQYLQACADALDAWRDGKQKTHEYKRVLYGSSSSYVWKWVPKSGSAS
jgi:hypothetical protein